MGFLQDLRDRILDFWDYLRDFSVTQWFVISAGLVTVVSVLVLAWAQFTYDPARDEASVDAPASLRIDMPAELTPAQRAGGWP